MQSSSFAWEKIVSPVSARNAERLKPVKMMYVLKQALIDGKLSSLRGGIVD